MDASFELEQHAKQLGLDYVEVPGGLGVRFEDTFNTYWALPNEAWHFLNHASAGTVENFRKLNLHRLRVIETLRRYFAERSIAIDAAPNGTWTILKGIVTTELSVGAYLTQVLAGGDPSEVEALRTVLKSSFVKPPSPKRTQRLFAEYGQPFVERAWPAADDMPSLLPETPLVALAWMGLCRAVAKESSFSSPEAFVAAAQPRGRIGAALLQFARRLPEVRASIDLCSGSMCVRFSDGNDVFEIAPASRSLQDLVRGRDPESAGNSLADKYLHLNDSRQRVIDAVYTAIARRGYSVDTSDGHHVGREKREFSIDIGRGLTTVLSEHGLEFAINELLAPNPALVHEALACLTAASALVAPKLRALPPEDPPKLELPEIPAGRIRELDARSEQVLSDFFNEADAIDVYFDRLKWRPESDTWADPSQWSRLAERFVDGEHLRPDAEMILVDQGDNAAERRMIEHVRDLEPHHEVWDQETEFVWRWRRQLPDIAAKWFNPVPNDDVPFAVVRARLGDPIAAQHVLMGLSHYDEVPKKLAEIPTPIIHTLVPEKQINDWRENALRWARDHWRWTWGDEIGALAVASNLGWKEVFDELSRNRFLVSGLLDGPTPGILQADRVLLAWSQLAPCPFLAKLLSLALSLDLKELAKRNALRAMGSVEFAQQNPSLVEQMTHASAGRINIALSIAWHRCRRNGKGPWPAIS